MRMILFANPGCVLQTDVTGREVGNAHARCRLNAVTVATGTATQLLVSCCLSADDESPAMSDQL